MGSIAKQENHQALTHRQRGGKSTDIAVDQTKLLWNQEAAILDATELLCQLMKEAGISRSDLAARMGTTKSNITQILDGSRNMTIRTLSDVMTHLGHEFKASCKAREDKPESGKIVIQVACRLTITGAMESHLANAFVSSPLGIPELSIGNHLSNASYIHINQMAGV